MAKSKITWIGDGNTSVFSVPFPYLLREHIHATIDGESEAFSFVNAGSIVFQTPPLADAQIKLSRKTPTEPLIDFVSGGTLTEADLDTANLQSLYVAEEASDLFEEMQESISGVGGDLTLPSLDDLLEDYTVALGEAPDPSDNPSEDYGFLAAYTGTNP